MTPNDGFDLNLQLFALLWVLMDLKSSPILKLLEPAASHFASTAPATQ